MPALKRDKTPTVATFLQLPVATRAELEAAIDGTEIRSLTDAVVAAAKLLNQPRTRTTKGSRP